MIGWYFHSHMNGFLFEFTESSGGTFTGFCWERLELRMSLEGFRGLGVLVHMTDYTMQEYAELSMKGRRYIEGGFAKLMVVLQSSI